MDKSLEYRIENISNKFHKILPLILFILVFGIAIADKGAEKYKNNTAALNINTTFPATLISNKLNSGFVYESSSMISQQINNNLIAKTFIITYQKGNIFYIIPYELTIK